MVIDLPSGEVTYMYAEPQGGWSDIYKAVKLVLRRVEPGTFTMGSPESELGRSSDETQHEVTITKPFYIGVFEITQTQYQLIAGYNPSEFKGDTKPVHNVSYNDIRGREKGAAWPDNDDVDDYSFLGKLRARSKMNFDLPTEAQWEYACRAGTTTALNNGTNLSCTNLYINEKDVNLDKLGRYWFNGGVTRNDYTYKGPTYVGAYQPNAWGIYDMHGNVCEWCLDFYSYSGYEPVSDPKGPSEGNSRVLRGGSWISFYAYYCRSAYRYYNYNCYPDNGSNTRGFRVALVQK